jgi:hypothetical protein
VISIFFSKRKRKKRKKEKESLLSGGVAFPARRNGIKDSIVRKPHVFMP